MTLMKLKCGARAIAIVMGISWRASTVVAAEAVEPSSIGGMVRERAIEIRWLESCSMPVDTALFSITLSVGGTVLFEGSAATKNSGQVSSIVDAEQARRLFDLAEHFMRGNKNDPATADERHAERSQFCVEVSLKDKGRKKRRRAMSGNSNLKVLLEAVRISIRPEQLACPTRHFDPSANVLASGTYVCSDYAQTQIGNVYLNIVSWCPGGEAIVFFEDGTLYRYAIRNWSYVLEEFNFLPPAGVAELLAMLRALPLVEVDQTISSSGDVGRRGYMAGIKEAERVRAWLGSQVNFKPLPKAELAGSCQTPGPPSHVSVLSSFIK